MILINLRQPATIALWVWRNPNRCQLALVDKFFIKEFFKGRHAHNYEHERFTIIFIMYEESTRKPLRLYSQKHTGIKNTYLLIKFIGIS